MSDAEAPDAQAVAAAVLTVPEVAAMSSGPVGQFRSYLPGGTVPGVRFDDENGVLINVVARYVPTLREIGDHVELAVAPLTSGRTITVSVDDIVLPGEQPPADADVVLEPHEAPGERPAD